MRTVIRDVRLFDGEKTTTRATVLIVDDRIAEYDHGPADIEIDGAGRTVLPGLIDAHTHTFDSSDLAAALTHGVTTELDMFCLPAHLATQRALADHRDDIADFRSAGTLATAPGGHPSQLMSAPGIAELGLAPFDTIQSPEQAPAFVRDRLAEGANYLKIVIDDGAVHGHELPVLSEQTARALVDAAHAAGLLVIAHAITAAEVRVALHAGVDGLAHVWTDDTGAADLVAEVAARGIFVISTLVYFEAITQQTVAAPDCAVPGTAAGAARIARLLYQAGVPLLAGTDATPFVPAHGADLHRELRLLTVAGLTCEEALAAATSVPARHFALTDRGRVAPGLRADLLLVDGDPTTDITATHAIAEVWRRGVRQAR
ncbi:amidohydrolase family protein [Nocardia goodfellowii]|uniref:Imidazolonepropionase-like amidohydrolase n=1 Tax=Nocardia goodfellowii TaxID=882446 RepID=A0ABS4QGL2_9NOCA|nr:amidohydrolase family protein [Nocardia goodfellowii]MBP2190810.1 imidazolonepropionase-like amidohydrolase [Nocardia goodfellowii]